MGAKFDCKIHWGVAAAAQLIGAETDCQELNVDVEDIVDGVDVCKCKCAIVQRNAHVATVCEQSIAPRVYALDSIIVIWLVVIVVLDQVLTPTQKQWPDLKHNNNGLHCDC